MRDVSGLEAERDAARAEAARLRVLLDAALMALAEVTAESDAERLRSARWKRLAKDLRLDANALAQIVKAGDR